jgi:hypothetical protein
MQWIRKPLAMALLFGAYGFGLALILAIPYSDGEPTKRRLLLVLPFALGLVGGGLELLSNRVALSSTRTRPVTRKLLGLFLASAVSVGVIWVTLPDSLSPWGVCVAVVVGGVASLRVRRS